MFRAVLLVVLVLTPFLIPEREDAPSRPSLAGVIAFRAGITAGIDAQRCKVHRVRRYIEFDYYFGRSERALPGRDQALYVPLASAYDPCDHVVEACNEMHARLDRWWGREKHALWVGREYRARLSASKTSCDLTFEHAVAPADWLSAARNAEIPMGLVGKPFAWLGRHDLERDEDGTLFYTTVVAGRHIDAMRVEVGVDDGVITSLLARGWQSPQAEAEIRELARDLRVRIGHDQHGYLVIAAGAFHERAGDR